MLLFLLSFYVHYDLLNCEENVTAKLNESSLVDYHHKLLQVNALLVDLELKTRKLSGLIADDHPYALRRETNALRDLIMRILTAGKDQNRQIPKKLTKPAQVLEAPLHATISPYPARSGPHFPPPFYQPVHWAYPLLSIFPQSRIERGASLYATSFSSSNTTRFRPKIQQVTSTPHTLSSVKKATSLGPKARDWFKGLAQYTRFKKKKRKTSRNQTQATVRIPPRTPPSYMSSIGGLMWEQFKEAEHGPLNEDLTDKVSRPGQTPVDPIKVWTTKMTTAGDVLYGKIKVQNPSSTQPPNPRYQELMRELDEGYLVVFGIEMFRLIAVKDKPEVQDVLGHVETIYNTSLRSGRLIGVNNSFLTIFGNLATMTSEDEIDALRTYSSLMFHTLLKRMEVLSPEVNSMIDQAEMSYDNAEGNRLLCSLSHFEDYPNTNKSSYSICEGLVDSILQPFRRPADSKSRQALSYISRALRDNFPQLLRDRGVRTPTTLSLIDTTISRIRTRSRKRKKKHHHHKKKRKRKSRFKPEYDNENTRANSQDLEYQHPSIVEAITTKRYITMKWRPTNAMTLTTYPPINHYPTPIPTHIPTKKIVPRKLVHSRNAMILKQRKQAGHARVASQSTRTTRYRETPKFEDMDSIDLAIYKYLENSS